jgi:hypothetical protein
MSAVSSSGPSQRANPDGVPSAAVSDRIHPAFGSGRAPGAEFEQLARGLERATEAPPNTELRSIALAGMPVVRECRTERGLGRVPGRAQSRQRC